MINVTKTYVPDLEKYKSYVDQIFSSGWFTNNGSMVQDLEKRLAEHLGVENILLVSNGTLALQVAYKLLGLTGDIITTPFSFVATASSMVWEGLNPVFVDISEDSLNIDVNKIEAKITEKTTAIVAVHVFGNACEVEKIQNIADKYNLKVIYDGAHAFGINYKDESLLNFGDMTTLSFHSTKIFHTIEGGAIIIKDDEMYKKAKLMINFGILTPDIISELGINAKMNEFQAAMGLCVLDDIPKIIETRKEVYNYYLNNLSEHKTLQFQKQNEYSNMNYAYFPIIMENERDLLILKENLNKENIFPRRYFHPSLEKLPYLHEEQSMPISNDISKRILCLPIYGDLDKGIIDKILHIISELNSD